VVNWWTNFWTAEGITFYYQNNVINQLEPSWSVEDQFVVEELENTLKHDAENPLALLLQPNETPESLSKFFSWKCTLSNIF
jgi:aminopeptidase N